MQPSFKQDRSPLQRPAHLSPAYRFGQADTRNLNINIKQGTRWKLAELVIDTLMQKQE
jgi:hypothetical protein